MPPFGVAFFRGQIMNKIIPCNKCVYAVESVTPSVSLERVTQCRINPPTPLVLLTPNGPMVMTAFPSVSMCGETGCAQGEMAMKLAT